MSSLDLVFVLNPNDMMMSACNKNAYHWYQHTQLGFHLSHGGGGWVSGGRGMGELGRALSDLIIQELSKKEYPNPITWYIVKLSIQPWKLIVTDWVLYFISKNLRCKKNFTNVCFWFSNLPNFFNPKPYSF